MRIFCLADDSHRMTIDVVCCSCEQIKMPSLLLIFSQSDYLIQIVVIKFAYLMVNSADPDQLASEAN